MASCLKSRLFLVVAAGLLFYFLATFPALYATKLASFPRPLPVSKWLYYLFGLIGGAMTTHSLWRATLPLYPGVFSFLDGNLYAGQMRKYAQRPLDVAQYMADLDPWSGEPFPGTKSAWRMAVYRSRYPDQVDVDEFTAIMNEVARPASPFKTWWETKSAEVRAKAETMDGAMRKCFECDGVGKSRDEVTCDRCDENGEMRILDQHQWDREEIIDRGDRTVYVQHYRDVYRMVKCPHCQGTKRVVRITACEVCHGLGKIPFSKRDIFFAELRQDLLKEARAFVAQTKAEPNG